MCEEHKELLEMIILLAILREIIWSQLSQTRSPWRTLSWQGMLRSSRLPPLVPVPPFPPHGCPIALCREAYCERRMGSSQMPPWESCMNTTAGLTMGSLPAALLCWKAAPFRRQRGASAWPGAPPPRGGVFTWGSLAGWVGRPCSRRGNLPGLLAWWFSSSPGRPR